VTQPYTRETLKLSSVAPDLIPQDAPNDVWNDARNVVFQNGETIRVSGDAPTLPTAKVPRVAVFLRPLGQGVWLYATEDGIHAHDGTDEFDVTPDAGWSGAGGIDTTWTACVLNGIGFINASDRDPVYWTGNVAERAQPLPDWPAGGRCNALRAHKSFLFAVGMLSEGNGSGLRVRWSDAAEAGTVPQEWQPSADNLAGFIDLPPATTACRDALTLRDDLLIYKGEGIWSLTFTGGNAVFVARKRFQSHGIAATNAVTAGPNDRHLFVADDGDVMLTDGVQVSSVLEGRAQRTFYADFTSRFPATFSATTLMREKLGIVIYPNAASEIGNKALLFDFESGDIGFRDVPDTLCAARGQALLDVGELNTWDGDDEAWDDDVTRWNEVLAASSVDDVLIGGAFGFLLLSDRSSRDFYDGPVQAFMQKSGLAFGGPQARKMVARVWPKVIGRTGDVLELRIGGQETTGGPIALSKVLPFTIGQGVPLDVFVQGRFLSLEVVSNGGAPWRMGSIDLEYRPLGAF